MIEGRCPVCDGYMVEKVAERVYTRQHDHLIYPAFYSECEECGEEWVSPDQSQRNDAMKRDALAQD